MLSANAFNLDQSKNLSCGKEVKKYFFGRSYTSSSFLSKYSDDEFQSMCDLLDQKFKNSEPHGSDQVWEKGQACAAFYEKDQQWHRATVLTVEPTKIQVFLFNSLPNKKILDWSKLKAFADEGIGVTENLIFGRTEKHCGKRRKCWLPAFSHFHAMFTKGLFFKVVKSLDCVVKS